MKLIYMREGCLNDLKHNLNNNVLRYKEAETWLDGYFKGSSWHLASTVEFDDIDLICDGSPNYDLDNSKKIYSSLKHLSPSQASDERLWAAMSHSIFWKYMRSRWPAEDYLTKNGELKSKEALETRYFVKGSKGLVRNGVARLWWYSYVSYDEDREDKFELTTVMLKYQDVAQNILERNFSRNNTLIKAILEVLNALETTGTPFYKRANFRLLMEYINSIGGVTVLDALPLHDVKHMVESKIKLLSPSTS